METPPVEGNAPARAMIPQNRNFARNARVNDPQGVRDPNGDTLDGRSAAMEKSVQEARTPKPKASDGYTYRIKVQNPGKNVVEIVFWEYQFHDPADPSLVARRQFLCGVSIATRARNSKPLVWLVRATSLTSARWRINQKIRLRKTY
jgi:alpha-mannosidase